MKPKLIYRLAHWLMSLAPFLPWVVAVLSLGCAGLAPRSTTTGPQTPTQSCIEDCRTYDDAYLVYYALGMAFSGATAASGTSGVLSATLADAPDADIALAATAAASGIATVVFNWLAGESAERYTSCVERCNVEPFMGEP